MEVDIKQYDKIMENLKDINAIAEALSCLCVDEELSIESTKTLGYRLMTISEESIELLRSGKEEKG